MRFVEVPAAWHHCIEIKSASSARRLRLRFLGDELEVAMAGSITRAAQVVTRARIEDRGSAIRCDLAGSSREAGIQ